MAPLTNLDAPDLPGLYVFIFPNGKRYVGVTRKSLRVRVNHHINAAKAGRIKLPVRAALAKHGLDSVHVFFPDADGCLFAAERALIAEYRAQGLPLYNMTDGGEGITGFNHAEQTRTAMSVSAKKSWTPERRATASKKLRSAPVRARLIAAQKLSWNAERRAAMANRLRARSAKLAEADILEIAERLQSGESCAAIGRAFGVTPEAISAIKHGKNWSHVTGITRRA